jgi:hypothetical protein
MDNKQRLKEVLLRGEPLHFEAAEPEEQRTVEASWIAEAARAGQAVQLANAIVLDELIIGLREDPGLHYCAKLRISRATEFS